MYVQCMVNYKVFTKKILLKKKKMSFGLRVIMFNMFKHDLNAKKNHVTFSSWIQNTTFILDRSDLFINIEWENYSRKLK